jgi:lactate permease
MVAGTFVPLIVVCMVTGLFGANRSFAEGLQVWKFCVFAAFAMSLPYFLAAVFLGPEFPSLLGGLVGLAIVISAAKRGFLIPDEPWSFPEKADWQHEWSGEFEIRGEDVPDRNISMLSAWSPYVLVALLLVVTRIDALPFKGLMQGLAISIPGLFGTGIGVSVAPLYLPGSIFLIAVLFTYFAHRMSRPALMHALGRSGRLALQASVALIFTVPMVQVFINSDGGLAGYERMPIALADGAAALTGAAWPLVSTFIGGLGAFVAGSNTVSNMMFSSFQFGVGQRIGVDPSWMVALQAVGGAAGNMICVHNVVAASAVVGMLGKEGLVIRRTFWPFLYYATFAAAIGYWIAWRGTLGSVNVGSAVALSILLAAALTIWRGTRVQRP